MCTFVREHKNVCYHIKFEQKSRKKRIVNSNLIIFYSKVEIISRKDGFKTGQTDKI